MPEGRGGAAGVGGLFILAIVHLGFFSEQRQLKCSNSFK